MSQNEITICGRFAAVDSNGAEKVYYLGLIFDVR